MPAINLIAVVAATVAAMIIGTLYYMPMSPMGKRWMVLLKAPPVDRSPGAATMVQIPLSILTMVGLAVLIGMTGAKGAGGGATVAFWGWLLVAFADAGNANFSGRPWSLWAINQVNYLITYLVAGALIGALS